MGRYTTDDQKGYQFALVKREPTGGFSEVEKDVYEYIEALAEAVEKLEKKLETNEGKG
ncbi:hypothetical protein [Rhizobium leguminosarum]|uniref:hypothetical protein n=1 Tax=Rhizobium leguminosarum TaxID=384 RepID=UPI0013EF0351|nr:hypothetical protein [Rhizobium leguminosarum]